MGTIVSIGEVLWDLLPDGEYLGGAPFNFAANCARLGHSVFFLSAVGQDPLGDRTLKAMERFGVRSNFVGRVLDAATGTVRVEFDSDGQPQYTINRPAAYDFVRLDEPTLSSIVSSRPDFLYFGTLSQLYPNNVAALLKLINALPDSLCFYDINLRRDAFDLALVTQLMFRAQVVKMNEDETKAVQELFGTRASNLEEFCRMYCRKFGWRAAWITLGAAGCAVFHEGTLLEAPGFPVASPSPVGAGDAFSAAVCHGILEKWPVPKIAEFANKLGALTASQPGAVNEWTMQEIDSISMARPSKYAP